MKVIDADYLYPESPADDAVRLFVAEDGVVGVEIDIGDDTLRLRLGWGDCLKLACRLFKAAKIASGELPAGPMTPN